MGATSVTGKGIGDSHGMAKPQNHCGGCGCGKAPEEVPAKKLESSCFITYKTGSSVKLNVGTRASIKVCK